MADSFENEYEDRGLVQTRIRAFFYHNREEVITAAKDMLWYVRTYGHSAETVAFFLQHFIKELEIDEEQDYE